MEKNNVEKFMARIEHTCRNDPDAMRSIDQIEAHIQKNQTANAMMHAERLIEALIEKHNAERPPTSIAYPQMMLNRPRA